MQRITIEDESLDNIHSGLAEAVVVPGHRDFELGSAALVGARHGAELMVQVLQVQVKPLRDLTSEDSEFIFGFGDPGAAICGLEEDLGLRPEQTVTILRLGLLTSEPDEPAELDFGMHTEEIG